MSKLSVQQFMEKAKLLFPEIDLDSNDTPYLVLGSLLDRLHKEYDKDKPSHATLKMIYQFVDWGCNLPRGSCADRDILTAASVSFYEEVPIHPKAFIDMPNWFRREVVVKSEACFSYHIGKKKYEELLNLYK